MTALGQKPPLPTWQLGACIASARTLLALFVLPHDFTTYSTDRRYPLPVSTSEPPTRFMGTGNAGGAWRFPGRPASAWCRVEKDGLGNDKWSDNTKTDMTAL
jgi:hypothetical protein